MALWRVYLTGRKLRHLGTVEERNTRWDTKLRYWLGGQVRVQVACGPCLRDSLLISWSACELNKNLAAEFMRILVTAIH
jgi:hypothetical protein